MKRLPLVAAISAAMLSSTAHAAYDAPGTDYSNAQVDSHISDESFEPLNMVNMFLCIIKATGAETLWDQNYRALVNDDKCEQQAGMSGGDSQNDGDRSSSSATEYADVIVSSSRADSESPQIVDVQFSMEDGEQGPERYLVRTEVSSAPGENTPFGELRFSWQSAITGQEDNKGDMRIASENNANIIQMIDSMVHDGTTFSQSMRVQIDDAQGTAGRGVIQGLDRSSWPPANKTYRLAYNSQYFLKDDGTTETCLARPETLDPIEKIWGYNLYNAETGAQLDIEAGFGFRYDINGSTRHGFIGTWGMWTENDDSPTTIIHDGTNVEYTVVNAPGKLIRQRKGLRDLSDGESFESWIETSPGNWQPMAVTWRQANERFEFDGSIDAGLTPGAFLWSSSLRQEINYQGDANLDGTHQVAFSTHEVVHPTDAIFGGNEITLTCYGDCPKPNVSKTDALNWNLYDGNFQDPTSPGSGTTYTLDPLDMTLRVGGEPVELAFTRSELIVDEQNPENSENFWGATVGEFVLQGTPVSSWEDLNASDSVTYRWEYGLDSWNQLTLVKDGNGDYFEFDKPLSFQYEHTTNRDNSAGNGNLYLLEYQGARNLHGIPWTEGANGWQPEVNIPDGTVLTAHNGTNYVVKAVGIERRMAEAPGQCSALTLPNPADFPLPDFADSDVAAALNAIKGEAFFTELGISNEAPRVIHGVIQE